MASRPTTRSISNKSSVPLMHYDNNTGRRKTSTSNIHKTHFPTTSHSVPYSPSRSQSCTSQSLHLFNDSQFPPISTPVQNSAISNINSSFSTSPISTTHTSPVTSSVHSRMSYLDAAAKNISSLLLPSLSTHLMTHDFWNNHYRTFKVIISTVVFTNPSHCKAFALSQHKETKSISNHSNSLLKTLHPRHPNFYPNGLQSPTFSSTDSASEPSSTLNITDNDTHNQQFLDSSTLSSSSNLNSNLSSPSFVSASQPSSTQQVADTYIHQQHFIDSSTLSSPPDPNPSSTSLSNNMDQTNKQSISSTHVTTTTSFAENNISPAIHVASSSQHSGTYLPEPSKPLSFTQPVSSLPLSSQPLNVSTASIACDNPVLHSCTSSNQVHNSINRDDESSTSPSPHRDCNIADDATISSTSSWDTVLDDSTTSTTSSCATLSDEAIPTTTRISSTSITTKRSSSKLPVIPPPENSKTHRFTPKPSRQFPTDFVLGNDFSPIQYIHNLASQLADPNHLSLSLYEDIRLLKTYIWMGVCNYQSRTYMDESCKIRFSHNHPTIIAIMRFITTKQKQIRRILQQYVEDDLHFLFNLTSYEEVQHALQTKVYSPHIFNSNPDNDDLIDITDYHYEDLFDILDTYMQLFFTFSNITTPNLSLVRYNVIPHIHESLDQSHNQINFT